MANDIEVEIKENYDIAYKYFEKHPDIDDVPTQEKILSFLEDLKIL